MNDTKTDPARPTPVVDNPRHDDEHAIQLGLLDAVRESLRQERHDVPMLMDQLHIYTQVHFMSEQMLLRLGKKSNGNYGAHVVEHEKLLQELLKIKAKLERGEVVRARELLGAHERHVLQHIDTWDHAAQQARLESG